MKATKQQKQTEKKKMLVNEFSPLVSTLTLKIKIVEE